MQEEWNQKGAIYAKSINDMYAFVEKHGWEKWKGKEPEDKRGHLTDKILALLEKANTENKVEEFRDFFPPSHAPLLKYLDKKGQYIGQLYFIEKEKIIFITGASYKKRQAYILEDTEVLKLDEKIRAVGKSKQGNIFAICRDNKIIITKGWQGEVISEFEIKKNKDVGITELIPFNNGLKVLSVTSQGIYLIDKEEENLIHPPIQKEEAVLEEEEYPLHIDMENATISNDNAYIVVGDQSYDHRIIGQNGEQIGEIGPQSSYPHFCLFSEDDSQLITNSCHFYNGTTIGVDTTKLEGLQIPPYEESEEYTIIDEVMRVYCGIAYDDLYVLGDAYGYIVAVNQQGKMQWRYFLGSTISGMTISDDKQTLWAASYAGIIHKLSLGKGQRDTHVIGNGNHYEEFRLLVWKDKKVLRW